MHKVKSSKKFLNLRDFRNKLLKKAFSGFNAFLFLFLLYYNCSPKNQITLADFSLKMKKSDNLTVFINFRNILLVLYVQ